MCYSFLDGIIKKLLKSVNPQTKDIANARGLVFFGSQDITVELFFTQ